MSEHKLKQPGEVKGQEYRKAQRKPIPAQWVKVARITERWFERHDPGYIKRRAKNQAEIARKAMEKAGSGNPSKEKENAPTGQETSNEG